MHNVTRRRHGRRWRRCCHALCVTATLGANLAVPAQAADMEVNIDNFTFTPSPLTVKAGTTIIFRNRDDIPHSIVGAKAEFHSKALDTDDTFSFTFAKSGAYEYFCGLHPQMKGMIVVAP